MKQTILIVGGGKVGTYLANLLHEQGNIVRVLEGAESEYPRLEQELAAGILLKGDGTNPEVLRSAGITSADVVAAVTRYDEMNLVITSLARFEFRVPKTVARVNIPKNSWLFTREMGVDVVLNQADLMAHLIAEKMTLGDMKTLLKLRKGEYSLVENLVHAKSNAVNTPIKELKLPAESVLCAIIREGTMIVPRGETIFKEGDEVLAVVHNADTKALADLMAEQ
jgi:trk system potassium uptake protein TrkA